MRFEDTELGWRRELEKLVENRYVRDYLKAISPHKLELVKNSASDGGDIRPRMCHRNVLDKVAELGGEAVYGWQVLPWLYRDNDDLDYVVTSGFHCNWLNQNRELVNVTPTPGAYHIFIRDDKRRYDFEERASFNNRTIYLDAYKQPSHARRVTTNVTYFTASGYGSRDKAFERFITPKSKDEIRDALPLRFINPSDPSELSQEAQKWIALKFSVIL